MAKHHESWPGAVLELFAAAEAAGREIPPAWPLDATVAVNPFLGQTGERLAQVAARLERAAGCRATMPRAWYLDRIADGRIATADLDAALVAAPVPGVGDAAGLIVAAREPAPEPAALPTLADLAADASGTDWPGIVADRIGAWAAGWFDSGQALWAAPRGPSPFAAWRAWATHDLTPEIHGLTGFAARIAEGPATVEAAFAAAARTLGLTAEMAEACCHRLLVDMGGWAQLARQRQWTAERDGAKDTTLQHLLTIRLMWEAALHDRYAAAVADGWARARDAYAAPVVPHRHHLVDAALQEAADRAAQRGLAGVLAAPAAAPSGGRPAVQAAFCIDVRSEVFRRALEATDPGIVTLGFAGFFGLATAHRGFGSDVVEHRLPVLLQPAVRTISGGPESSEAETARRLAARAVRAWRRFKLAAVSSFAFVEATGPLYVAKLVRDALGLADPAAPGGPAPRPDPELPLEARVTAAASVLRAMSLTGGFARLVVIAGHGARVTNNPYESALHCGACGGYSGEANARLLAALLNDDAVRKGVAEAEGIAIPPDTLFVAALHDTTGDTVTLYDADRPAPGHAADVNRLRGWLAAAGVVARAERALRLPGADAPGDIGRRVRDWAELRPEWGLAGCSAFIAAPRRVTLGKGLAGRAFLHDYDWRADDGFAVLELILTAPVVVASWISLQYYGSTVAPGIFGAGNKLLHNVTGGVGVVEGNGGTLRVGLPWQSVHDGADFAHEPLRLSVCVAAPEDAILDVLGRHPAVRALFDNGWMALFGLDDRGAVAWRYGDRHDHAGSAGGLCQGAGQSGVAAQPACPPDQPQYT